MIIFNHMVKYKNDDELDLVFKALGDRTRRNILMSIGVDEKTVLEIAEPFQMSLPAVSKHLKVLERARLINRKIDGRIHKISMNPEKIKSVNEWLQFHTQFWVKNLDQLKNYLDEKEKE